jgi:hypothetical protein
MSVLGRQFVGSTKDYEGRVGDATHITRVQRGHLPIEAVAKMPGARGEVPGAHRNKQGEHWDHFKGNIATHGIKNPLFITVDHDQEPKLSEGNHRRDAAVELGHSHVPVEIRYFGHAER